MAYGNDGRYEYANKSTHSHIINDDIVSQFISECKIPKKRSEINIDSKQIEILNKDIENPIEHIVVIDGGSATIPIKEEFPSSEFAFIQFGALKFSLLELENISSKKFIGPEDISKIKDEFGRLKLALPLKNVIYKDEKNLNDSVRKSIFEFFNLKYNYKFFNILISEKFIDVLKWLIYEEFRNSNFNVYKLGSCPNPNCRKSNIPLIKEEMVDYQFKCPFCNTNIYLTDILRLHELIDEEMGANKIIIYLLRSLEQFLLILIIKIILENEPELLNKTLFIQDGPLAFFGQTAKLYAPMQELIKHLLNHFDLFLIGLEKSGPFVEHAKEIFPLLEAGQILILDTKYIYTYIKPRESYNMEPFGDSTYYGNKLIFKSHNQKIYSITLPMNRNFVSPKISDFRNINVILKNINDLNCELYSDAILPLVLVNRLVSLSDHPGSAILGRYARNKVNE